MSKHSGYFLLVALAVSVVLCHNAAAHPEITLGNDFGVGARAMGMGGAFIGVADDSTALQWNPAGLSQIKRMEFFGALSHEKIETQSEFFENSTSTFVSKTRPNSFGCILPVPTYQGGLAFGLAVNRLQSFESRIKIEGFNDVTEDVDPELYQLYLNELIRESGDIYSWSFGAAVDIAPGISLGGCLNFLNGEYIYNLDLDADDVDSVDPDVYGISYRDATERDYAGVEGKIGLMARLAQQFSLGVTVDIPLDFSVEEYLVQESFWFYDDGTDESDFFDSGFDYDISRPFRFGGGVAFHPVPGAILAADILYTDWTQTEYSEPPSEDISNEDFLDFYRDTTQFRVGAEYTFPNVGLSLRGGYIYDPTPFNPEWIEISKERQFITFGVGMNLDDMFSLDAAYVRGFWDQGTTDTTTIEERVYNRIFMSARYRF